MFQIKNMNMLENVLMLKDCDFVENAYESDLQISAKHKLDSY